MKLSKETEYCLIALKHLANQAPDTILQTSQVAEATGLPKPFLARIFVKLVKQDILKSFRGKQRGYQLSRASDSITMRDILEAVEGIDVFQRCVFWSESCSDSSPCILHDYWKNDVRANMVNLMESLTLKDLAKGKDY